METLKFFLTENQKFALEQEPGQKKTRHRNPGSRYQVQIVRSGKVLSEKSTGNK